MSLNNNKLREILNQIQNDRQKYDQYGSKWISIVNLLYNNTDLRIAGVARAGSRAKHTDLSRSDMDVIFSLSNNPSCSEIYPRLREQLRANFGAVANIQIGQAAIHVEFYSPRISIDLVLVTQQEFNKEYQNIKDIRQLNQIPQDAIRLVKYAIDRAGLSYNIPGYEIELNALNLNYEDLAKFTEQIIYQLQNLINRYSYVENVLRYLR